MEKLIAQFRFAAVVLTGAVLLDAYEQLGAAATRGPVMAAAWGGALLYAVAVLLAEP